MNPVHSVIIVVTIFFLTTMTFFFAGCCVKKAPEYTKMTVEPAEPGDAEMVSEPDPGKEYNIIIVDPEEAEN